METCQRGLRWACYNAEFFSLMAILHPFRALRYDPARVEPQLAVTQPYDKITPAMQEKYYEASPYTWCESFSVRPSRGWGGLERLHASGALVCGLAENWGLEGGQ